MFDLLLLIMMRILAVFAIKNHEARNFRMFEFPMIAFAL